MAMRAGFKTVNSFHKDLTVLFAVVKFGASGAPALQAWNPNPLGAGARSFSAASSAGFLGVKSVTRTSQGVFVVTLQDAYNRLLSYDAQFDTTLVSGQPLPAAPTTSVCGSGPTASVNDGLNVITNAAGGGTTGGMFTLKTFNVGATPVVTDPANGEYLMLSLWLSNSGVL